ncbi:MAG: hypothetical protein ACTHMI_06770 [Mucilaginibacter sp.]
MKKIVLIFLGVILFASATLAQEVIKAKDAHNYIGKKVTVIGKIKSIAGPGYLSSMSFYLVTDSTEVGIVVIVPREIWTKSKILNENQKGKIMKIAGLIKLGGEPYTTVENLSDVKILP